ncbi:aminotransferase class-V [Xylariomycetidae sp. FL0641]|nr:aminotransferase class-V [Xylariomycetidae sp. FL0641]
MTDFNVAEARANFPALQQEQVFFDNAGGSQCLGSVIESICDYLSRTNVQLGASYKTGKLSTERYTRGMEAGAKYINAHPDEIVFGPSTTQLFRNVAAALTFAEGDEIVLSTLDHEANISPWVDLAARQKLEVKWWWPSSSASTTPTTDPALTPENLAPLLTPRTRLVACTHASNILGTIHDVAAIAAALHAAVPGALLAVDGVAYAPHRPLDVQALGVDFCKWHISLAPPPPPQNQRKLTPDLFRNPPPDAFSWYKVYGPHLAQLYARRATALPRLRSLGHFFFPPAGTGTAEQKLGLAGAAYEAVAAVPAAVAYLSGRWAGVEAHEARLQAALLAYLLARAGDVTVYGSPDASTAVRVPTVSFRVAGRGAEDVVRAVERCGGGAAEFGIRWGAFYSQRLVREVLGLGPDGVVRVSMVHYNTLEEVEAFIAVLDKVLSEKT